MTGIVFLALRIAIALALFGFLAWALWLLWRDLQQSTVSPVRPIPRLTVTIELPALVQTLHFQHAEVQIGRDPLSDCRLDDPTISGRHARLVYRQEQWWAEDMGSTNGTLLNDLPLETPAVLATGDVLRLGQARLSIEIQPA